MGWSETAVSASLPFDTRIVLPGREQDAPATGDGRLPLVAGASSSRSPPNSSPNSDSTREQDAPATPWDFFNPRNEIDLRTGGNLPHWEQGAVWYFITFRLADALPRAIAEELKRERDQWKEAHGRSALSRSELAEYRRLFSARYEDLLPAGSGACVLRDPRLAGIVRDALGCFQGQRYLLDDYVIMPNHVHVLVKPLPGHGLVAILHSWKSFTANRINRQIARTGQLWQHESYDHIVRSEAALHAFRRYIRDNPTK
jgi:REP element-mobilizing transposase RayT